MILVDDYLPDGTSPCVTAWHVNEADWVPAELSATGRGFFRPETYEFAFAETPDGRRFTARELVELDGDLADYRENLRVALIDGSAREQEPVSVSSAA